MLKAETRQKIDSLAVRLRSLLEVSLECKELDLKQIVKNLKGTIEYFTGGEQSERVVKNSKDGFAFVIYINENNTPARQKFSIAHEIGHLFMDMKYKTSGWEKVEEGASYARGNDGPIEEAANEFARAFLMPKETFLQSADNTSDDNYYYPKDIAKEFDVTEEAVLERGRGLGLWN
jgi:Zn-dependent peptidase ImmA (M78 family)